MIYIYRDLRIFEKNNFNRNKQNPQDNVSVYFPDENLRFFSEQVEKEAFIEENKKIENISSRSVYSYEVPITNLPSAFDGMRILHLTDLHFGTNRDYKNSDLFSYLGALYEKFPIPDIIVLTGDFIQKTYDELGEDVDRFFLHFYPTVPRYFVLGNHDYLHKENKKEVSRNDPKENIIPFFEKLGYKNLTNQKVTLEKEGKSINLVGLDDYLEGNPQMPSLKENEINLLITHELDGVKESEMPFLDLVLSGHTHAGEINLGPLSGYDILKYQKVYSDYHKQRSQWKIFGNRTASHINPGLHTENPLGRRFNTDKEGASFITLRSFTPSVPDLVTQ